MHRGARRQCVGPCNDMEILHSLSKTGTNLEDYEFTQNDFTQLCMFAVSDRSADTGFRHKPRLTNTTSSQCLQRLRCQHKWMREEWFGLTMWVSSLSLTIVELQSLQVAFKLNCQAGCRFARPQTIRQHTHRRHMDSVLAIRPDTTGC